MLRYKSACFAPNMHFQSDNAFFVSPARRPEADLLVAVEAGHVERGPAVAVPRADVRVRLQEGIRKFPRNCAKA